MDQYGAHILATTRRSEFAADAAAARLAAATRERSANQLPSAGGVWRGLCRPMGHLLRRALSGAVGTQFPRR